MRRALLAAAALVSAQAAAQVVIPPVIDPGALQQRQMDEERRRRELEREQRKPVPEPLKPPPEKPVPQTAPDSVRFLAREIEFTASEILSRDELEAIARDYRGREVSLADLQKLAERVNELYRAKGVVTAQAVIPPQDVSSGVVHVRLVEGRLGRTRIEGNESTRASYVEDRLRMKPGDVIDLRRLEQALVRFNRTNEAQLKAELKPGDEFGTTDLQLAVIEPPRHDLRLTYDNMGSLATGEWRTGLSYLNRSLLGWRDELWLSYTEADGQESRAISYGVPVNTWGGRLSGAYFVDNTRILHGAVSSLGITGEAEAGALTLRQPSYVTNNTELDVVGGAKKRYSATWISGVFLQRTDTEDGSLGLELQTANERSSWFASLTRLAGHAFTVEDTSYRINRGTLRYSYDIGGGFAFRASTNGQWSKATLLPSSEQFFLGGEGSVRGYPVGILSGDKGYAVTFELQHPVWNLQFDSGQLATSGFFFTDYGKVWPFRPPNSSLSPQDHLASFGWGIHASYGRLLYARLTFGFGLTDAPPTARENMVHFQMAVNFR